MEALFSCAMLAILIAAHPAETETIQGTVTSQRSSRPETSGTYLKLSKCAESGEADCYSFTAAIGSRTASALFASASFSGAVSST